MDSGFSRRKLPEILCTHAHNPVQKFSIFFPCQFFHFRKNHHYLLAITEVTGVIFIIWQRVIVFLATYSLHVDIVLSKVNSIFPKKDWARLSKTEHKKSKYPFVPHLSKPLPICTQALFHEATSPFLQLNLFIKWGYLLFFSPPLENTFPKEKAPYNGKEAGMRVDRISRYRQDNIHHRTLRRCRHGRGKRGEKRVKRRRADEKQKRWTPVTFNGLGL